MNYMLLAVVCVLAAIFLPRIYRRSVRAPHCAPRLTLCSLQHPRRLRDDHGARNAVAPRADLSTSLLTSACRLDAQAYSGPPFKFPGGNVKELATYENTAVAFQEWGKVSASFACLLAVFASTSPSSSCRNTARCSESGRGLSARVSSNAKAFRTVAWFAASLGSVLVTTDPTLVKTMLVTDKDHCELAARACCRSMHR